MMTGAISLLEMMRLIVVNSVLKMPENGVEKV
jgi:hypothetical protein